MRVEDRMRQEGARALQRGRCLQRERRAVLEIERGLATARSREDPNDVLDVGEAGGFVERDPDAACRVSEVDADRFGGLPHGTLVGPFDVQRVEVRGVGLTVADSRQRVLQRTRQRVHALAYRPESRWPVIHGVHRGDVRQERLRRADVRRRLFSTNVLLARLERHPVRLTAARVNRYADDAAWRLSDERLTRRKERRVRPAVAQRNAEAL